MKGFLIRFSGEARANFILNWRYWPEALATLIGYTLIFVAIFFGVQLFTGGAMISGWGEEAAIRYAIWVLCLTAFVGLPQKVQEEAMTGVLEQRFLTPKGGISNLIMSHVAGLLLWAFLTVLLFLALLLVTRTSVHFDAGIVPVILLILMGIEGVGFLLGGLALLIKRIGAVTQLLQTAFLGLALLPADRLPDAWRAVVQTLPLANGLPLLNDLLLNRTSFLTAVGRSDFWVLLISSFGYLGLGAVGFQQMVRQAKQRGLLAQY